MKKHLLIIAVLIAFVATAAAQKDEYIERYGIGISLGGQCSNHPSSFYWAGKMLMEWRERLIIQVLNYWIYLLDQVIFL